MSGHDCRLQAPVFWSSTVACLNPDCRRVHRFVRERTTTSHGTPVGYAVPTSKRRGNR